jgi:hypothetical protein
MRECLKRRHDIPGMPLSTFGVGNGVAASATLTDSAGTIVASGLTIGLTGSGANIIASAVTMTAGDTVSLLSGTIIGV